jgi:hypothetical protein
VAVGDINGDGKPDIIVTSGNSGFFSIFQNTTVGTTISFAPKQDFTLLMHPDALVVADFDQDGRTDIVTSNFSDDNVSVYRNTSTDGMLSLASRVDYPSGNFSSDVTTGDLDLDGKLDLIVRTDGQFSFLKNNSTPGAISFASPQDFTLPASNTSVGDLNGDGLQDLYFTGNMTDNKLYLNKGHMQFDDITAIADVAGRPGPWKTGVTMVDINGDGKLDIIAGNLGLNSKFRASTDEPMRTYVKDFDNNGSFDAFPALFLPDIK